MQRDTVLIVDDEPQIRRLLRNALQPEMARILEARTGREAIDLAAAEDPDVIVLDLGLPDMRGSDVCREIRKWSAAWIVVLSVSHSDREKVLLFDVGADDYVTKPFSKLEFTARIRAHRRRLQTLRPPSAIEPVTIADLVVNLSARTIRRGEEPIHLTPLEWDLLRFFLSHAECTLTHTLLLEAIWGSLSEAPQKSLRVHIANLRRKIERDPISPQLIITEPGVGYRWEGTG
jgi:two-component system KDP operon response regulator KdpE